MSATVPLRLLALAASLAVAVQAGPVTTVPWNGYTGAVSFTYDDARKSQIPTLIPQLDALGVKATFFLTYGAGGDLSTNKAAWIKAGKSGHEMANHTYDHQNVAAGNTQVKKMADDVRGFDPSFDVVTFAYPNCAVGGTDVVGAENFIGRGCGSTAYSWGSQPSDWMNVQGLILSNNVITPAITLLNAAKTNNTWVTTIVHDVTASPDQYSLTPENNKTMVQQAITNNLWIGTFQQVAAYYRAHFAMDAAAATTTTTGWTLKWTSPHAKMPKSVILRVKLDSKVFGDSITVSQGGTKLAKQSDGTYLLDFMKLSLDVAKTGPVGVDRTRSPAVADLDARRTSRGVVVTGSSEIAFDVSIRTFDGRRLASKLFESGTGDGETTLALDPLQARSPLLAVFTARDGSGLRTVALAPVE